MEVRPGESLADYVVILSHNQSLLSRTSCGWHTPAIHMFLVEDSSYSITAVSSTIQLCFSN